MFWPETVFYIVLVLPFSSVLFLLKFSFISFDSSPGRSSSIFSRSLLFYQGLKWIYSIIFLVVVFSLIDNLAYVCMYIKGPLN